MQRKLTAREEELARMAARGVEDGHDMKWFSSVARSRRELDIMDRSARAAKERLDKDEASFKPSRHPR